MKLIVGLGNPDKKYEKTYHNIGFLCVDALAASLGLSFSKKYGNAKIAEGHYNGEKIILAKPQTYMNLSGESVLKIKNKFKLEDENILTILDDIDLPVGVVRYRQSGSAGTHNGLRNIIKLLGTNEIPRLRIGIGRNEKMDLADFVLSKISSEDNVYLQDAIVLGVDKITDEFLG